MTVCIVLLSWTYTLHLRELLITTTTTRRFGSCVALSVTLFVETLAVDMDVERGAATRQRRLRSWWRHEQQTVAAVLATV